MYIKMLAYSGHAHFESKQVDVNQVINDRLSMSTTAVSDRATIRLQLTPQLPPIRTGLSQINRLLLNLIISSSKPSPLHPVTLSDTDGRNQPPITLPARCSSAFTRA
jgi:hypothetical protein